MTQTLCVKANGKYTHINLQNANALKVILDEDCAYVQVLFERYGFYIRTNKTNAHTLQRELNRAQTLELLAESCELRYFDF